MSHQDGRQQMSCEQQGEQKGGEGADERYTRNYPMAIVMRDDGTCTGVVYDINVGCRV